MSDEILGQVALGYSAFIDRNRAVTATRLTVFPLKPDQALDRGTTAGRRSVRCGPRTAGACRSTSPARACCRICCERRRRTT